MANNYFTYAPVIIPNTRALSLFINTQFSEIETAFAMLPVPANPGGGGAGGAGIGTLDMPQHQITGNYTLALTDRGKHLYHKTGEAPTLTIPPNASIAMPIGAAITLVNGSNAGAWTVAPGAGVTLLWVPSHASGSRTLTGLVIATLLQVEANLWLLNGNGVA